MKFRIVAMLIFLCCGLFRINHGYAEPGLKPMRFDAVRVDAGEVYQGRIYEHEFCFTNISNCSIAFEKVSASCSCTVSDYDKNAIKPGGVGKIRANVNTTHKEGRINNYLIVSYVDCDGKKYSDRLDMDMAVVTRGKYYPSPMFVDVDGLRWDEKTSRTIKLVQKDRISGSAIVDIEAPDYAKCVFTRIDEFSWNIDMNLDFQNSPGYKHDKLVITTDDPNFDRIEVPIMGYVEGRVIITPRHIIKKMSIGSGDKYIEFLVESGHGDVLNVTDITDENRHDLEYRAVEDVSGGVRVKIDVSAFSENIVRKDLKVKVKLKDEEMIIPVSVIVVKK